MIILLFNIDRKVPYALDGRIDALINNAGYGLVGPEECVTLDEAQRLFDVNFFGALRLIQAVLPTMRQQRSGHILNITSGVGIHALPGLGLCLGMVLHNCITFLPKRVLYLNHVRYVAVKASNSI